MLEGSQTSNQYKPTVEEILEEVENNGWNTAVSATGTGNEPPLLEDAPNVQTGTHQMDKDQGEPSTESLVTEFNTFGKVIAEHTVLRCRAVSRAKAKGKNGYEEFCDWTKLNAASSTTRKYAIIGAEADWLLPLAPRLPPEWTTIYYVVTLGQVKAEEMARLGTLHPQVTAKELKAAAVAEVSDEIAPDLAVSDETAATAEPCVFQIDASDLSDQDRLELYSELMRAVLWLGLTVTGLPDRLAETLIIEREAA
jgi:hypothetical protein